MFKKLTVILLTLTTIFSGISAYKTTKTAAEPVKAESRQNSATETNNRKLDYSAEQDTALQVVLHMSNSNLQ